MIKIMSTEKKYKKYKIGEKKRNETKGRLLGNPERNMTGKGNQAE